MLRKPDDFLRSGSKVFSRAAVNVANIDGWKRITQGKIADAGREENSPTTRLGAAYDAMLNMSLAVLSAHGWRAGGAEGHHREALEAACAYAGLTSALHDQIDAIRDLRNNQYRGIEPSEADIAFALQVLEKVVPSLLARLP